MFGVGVMGMGRWMDVSGWVWGGMGYGPGGHLPSRPSSDARTKMRVKRGQNFRVHA